MCQFAGDTLQFYKNLGDAFGSAATAGARAQGRAIGCGVLDEVWRQEVGCGHVMCRQIRIHGGDRAPIGSTVVSKAEAYLNSERMLWLFWLAIESA